MRLIQVLVLAASMLVSLAAGAQEAKEVTINIEQQPLRDALSQFASQTGFQVLRRDEDVALDGLMAPRVVGRYTPQAAIGRLLANSRLNYEFVNARTVRISSGPARPERKSGAVTAGPLKLAQVMMPAAQESGAGRAAESAQADEAPVKGIPEILVKGQRSANTDIRRSEDDIQPYVVFTADDIRESMAEDLMDFIASYLPMNTAPSGATVPNVINSGFNGNVSEVNLRGLGGNQTLILVNGRRMPGVANGSDVGQADIRGIALSSIQRIEVLPATAGGIYGGGATGGVINIILKRDFSGMELTGTYGNTFSSDVGSRRLEGQAGFMLEGGRTSIMVSGSYSETARLTVGDRDYLARARDLMLKNNRAAFYGGTVVPAGATANIRSTTTQPLTLKAGDISLGSTIAHVPVGYAGPASDNGLAFLQTAGSFNLDIPQGPGGVDRSLNQAPKVWSGALNLRREFTGRIEAFLDLSARNNQAMTRTNRLSMSVITLPSTAPNNPFVQNIRVQFPGSDFPTGTDMLTETDSLEGIAGLLARLPHQWTLHADYGWSRSQRTQHYSSQVIRSTGTTALANGTLNILRDVNAYPLDYTPYLLPSPSYLVGPYDTLFTSGSVRMAGPTLSLPGGPVMLSTSLETRKTEVEGNVNTLHNASGTTSYIYGPPRNFRTDSGYAEVTAPLVSATNALRWVRTLDLQASYRHDRTTTRALSSSLRDSISVPSPEGPFPSVDLATNRVSADQYTLGLRYQPMEAVALRVSYGAGILPPSLFQLVPLPIGSVTVNGVDPFRKNEPVGQVEHYSAVGNINLLPEQSRSWSFGAILAPERIPGLRLSVDYTRIRKRDEIAYIASQSVLDLEFQGLLAPGHVVREPLSAQDQAAGYLAGRIKTFSDGYVNVAHAEVDTFDMKADYGWRTTAGAFRASLLATWQPHLRRMVMRGSTITDLVGYNDGPLEWRGTASLTWDRQGWSAGWKAQYNHSRLIYASSAAQTTIDSAVLGQGDDTVPYRIHHDVFVRYRLAPQAVAGQAWLGNSEIMLGVRNLFDKDPPILATTSLFLGGYDSYGDPLGRRYTLSLTKRFD